MTKRLTIKPSNKPAMSIDRRAIKSSRLVYVICTTKANKYPNRRSRIIYIGTTEVGVHRVASNVAQSDCVS